MCSFYILTSQSLGNYCHDYCTTAFQALHLAQRWYVFLFVVYFFQELTYILSQNFCVQCMSSCIPGWLGNNIAQCQLRSRASHFQWSRSSSPCRSSFQPRRLLSMATDVWQRILIRHLHSSEEFCPLSWSCVVHTNCWQFHYSHWLQVRCRHSSRDQS